jgi:TonB family protein
MSNMGQAVRRFKRIGLALPIGAILIGSFLVGITGAGRSLAQESDRKVISRVEPEYPDQLKKLYIGGVVRVEAQVASNGTVRNVKLLGGNPILGQSTMKAVKMWKYAPASAEETVTVKWEFDPHK